jgi:hypothetical protein
MAIFHLSVKTFSRAKGQSATAAAAYRSASRIVDERTGETHDYTRRGGVESSLLILPPGAIEWAADREALWNAAEQAETRKNSTVAREFEIALPDDLSPAERERLAHDFAREIVERHGCASDVCIHAPGKGDNRNHHAHILVSTRRLGPKGFTKKTRELDDQKTGTQIVTQWRERFASLQNERLRENGIEAHVDHRTLEAQGVDRPPGEHDGPAVSAMKRKGRSSRRDEDQQQRQREAAQHAQQRQAAEVARELSAAQRLRRRLSREPNRLHGENPGSRYARLDGLTREDRQGGRSVWRFKPQGGAKLGAVAVIDHGDSISIPKTSDSRIGAAIQLAKEKGWTGLVLTGSDEFKQKAAAAAFRAGLSVENPEIQDYINELRRKSEGKQKALQAHSAPPATAATPAPATLPKTQETPFSGLSPAELGDRLRQVESGLERQKAALTHADRMGYATQCNKEKHLKTKLAHERERIIEDSPMLRGVFSAHASLKFGEALEAAQADRRKAAEEITAINNTNTLGRLWSAGKRREAERRLADAQRREQAAQRQIEKIEEASKRMADSKVRAAYRRWAIDRMKEHNVDIAGLGKLIAEASEERARIERRADFSPGEYRSLTEEKKRLQGLGDTLFGDSRRAFEAARDPEAERRRKEDEADTQRKLQKLRESNAARAKSTQSPLM